MIRCFWCSLTYMYVSFFSGLTITKWDSVWDSFDRLQVHPKNSKCFSLQHATLWFHAHVAGIAHTFDIHCWETQPASQCQISSMCDNDGDSVEPDFCQQGADGSLPLLQFSHSERIHHISEPVQAVFISWWLLSFLPHMAGMWNQKSVVHCGPLFLSDSDCIIGVQPVLLML